MPARPSPLEPPSESRMTRRRARTQGAILEAAEASFRSRGFAGATIEEIAADADVGVGSIYHYFASKEALFLAVADRALAVNERYMEQAYESPGTSLERLVLASAAYLRFFVDYPFYFRTVALPHHEAGDGEPAAAAQRIADRVERLITRLEDLIRAARDAGELADCDPHLLARFCWAAWNGVVAASLRPDRLRLSADGVAAVLQEGQRILLLGLAAPAVDPDR